jgi:hypothetical protein
MDRGRGKAKDLGGEVAHTQRLYEQYSAVRSLTRTTRPSLLGRGFLRAWEERPIYYFRSSSAPEREEGGPCSTSESAQEASTVTSALQTDARLLSTLRAELEQSLNDLTKTTLERYRFTRSFISSAFLLKYSYGKLPAFNLASWCFGPVIPSSCDQRED